MARSASVSDAGPSRRRSQRKPPPQLQSSSELSELKSSSDDSFDILSKKRPTRGKQTKKPDIEKIVKQNPRDDSEEPSYVCKKKGSKELITLTETELKHVPALLATFKRHKKVFVPESDDVPTSPLPKAFSDPLELSGMSDSSDGTFLRSKRSKTKRGADKSKNTVRRSTRSSRSRKSFDFTVHQDDVEQSAGTDDDPTVIRKLRSRRIAVESSYQGSSDEDLPEDSSARKKSNRRYRDVTNAQAHTHISDKPSDEHQPTCSKCLEKYEPDLVKIWLRLDKNRKRKPRAGSVLDRFPTLEDVYKQGCWLECKICTNSYHFGCLPHDMKKDISAQHKKERLDLISQKEAQDRDSNQEPITIPPEKKEQQPDLKLTLKCPACVKPFCTQCVICAQPAALIKNSQEEANKAPTVESQSANAPNLALTAEAKSNSRSGAVPCADLEKETLIFRCTSCKRAAHYSCLPSCGEGYPKDFDEIVEYWQSDWTCADCDELSNISVEIILAWRKPVPKVVQMNKVVKPGATEPTGELCDKAKDKSNDAQVSYTLPSLKDPFEPAEYLCKYENFSFTDCSWVTHSYLCAKHPNLLRNFLTRGPTLNLKQYSGEDLPESDDSGSDTDSKRGGRLPFNLEPDEDAQSKIPPAWLTPQRILSIEFEDELLIEDVRESEIPDDPEEMYEQMERAYIKWEEQSYADATWSDKTPKDSPYFPAFMSALRQYMQFRNFVVPTVKSPAEFAKLDAPRRQKSFAALDKQPDFIPNQLMGFQLEGLNFCYYNWHNQHPTILADEMGLGKTVQICSLIAVLKNKEKRMPFLIVVPNSTLGNWSRECAKWIPDLKCVPLPGDSDSCEVVQQWELFKDSRKNNKRQLAACVVLATYQSAEKHANLLREVQRWEVLVVDEGQRLKSGPKSGLFRALNSLTVGHKVLMSGTPLNNNLRELFNLLSFLQPREYPPEVIDEMEVRYSALTPELIDELRAKIRPYMLRRTKETVLDLPPLTEIIVPITMRPLQKQVYRGLLSRKADLITSIYTKGGQKKKTTRAGFQNLLMQLRKTLAHPYLYDAEIEPSNVSSAQVQENLVEASAKLVFLQKFIPKLLARGHRMLIFSQFTMFLDVMERFLDGEKWQYLRLDGSTSQLDRQARIDHFNRGDSIYNIFLLSTRAGGAGINLATADVVIILDPDWNPHNDLQAISRAHRFGQKKPVSVFKLMVKGSAEEKIVQTGKRKLVLDHLVIQKASEEEVEAHDVASILQFGAQELLTASDEALKKDVRYTDAELDDLIQRTVDEAKSKQSAVSKHDKSFAFARVWEGRGKDLADVDAGQDEDDGSNAHDQRTFWDNILQANQEAERAKALQEEAGTGRGHRKRKDVDYQLTRQDDSPQKKIRLDELSNAGDDNYEPKSRAPSVSSVSEVEPDALVDDIKELLPSPTEAQLKANRELEEALKAERRKLKWEKQFEKIRRAQEAAAHSTSNRPNALSNQPTAHSIPNQPLAHSIPNQPITHSTSNHAIAHSTPNQPIAHSIPNHPITHSTSNHPIAHSTPNQPIAHSPPNQPNAHSTSNQEIVQSTPNQPIIHSTPNQSIPRSTPNQSIARSTPNEPIPSLSSTVANYTPGPETTKPVVEQTQGTYDIIPLDHPSNPVNDHHPPNEKKARRVTTIQVPDLKGMSNDERRQKMDMILRELVAKAKALNSPRLDSIIRSIRSKGQAEQARLMAEAARVVKELTAQVRSNHSSSTTLQHRGSMSSQHGGPTPTPPPPLQSIPLAQVHQPVLKQRMPVPQHQSMSPHLSQGHPQRHMSYQPMSQQQHHHMLQQQQQQQHHHQQQQQQQQQQHHMTQQQRMSHQPQMVYAVATNPQHRGNVHYVASHGGAHGTGSSPHVVSGYPSHGHGQVVQQQHQQQQQQQRIPHQPQMVNAVATNPQHRGNVHYMASHGGAPPMMMAHGTGSSSHVLSEQQQQHRGTGMQQQTSGGYHRQGRNSVGGQPVSGNTNSTSTERRAARASLASSSTLPDIITLGEVPPPGFTNKPKSSVKSMQKDSNLDQSFLR